MLTFRVDGAPLLMALALAGAKMPGSTERMRMPPTIGGLAPVTLATESVRVVSPVAVNSTNAPSLAPPSPKFASWDVVPSV